MTSTIEGTLQRAMFLARYLNRCDFECVVVAILIDLGVSTNRVAFVYLKWSIIQYHKDPTQLMGKGVYATVGKMFKSNVSEEQIEEGIRRLIAEAWEVRNEEVWSDYFPMGFRDKGSPTASEFISMLSCFLELWQGCCEEVRYERG